MLPIVVGFGRVSVFISPPPLRGRGEGRGGKGDMCYKEGASATTSNRKILKQVQDDMFGEIQDDTI